MAAAERREQLLDAALAVIARDGYAGATIGAIAREAGVTRPVVYSQFEGLGELLHALLDRQEERALAQLADAIRVDLDRGDVDELLLAGLRSFLGSVAASPDTWRLALLPPESTPAEVRDRVARDRAALLERLEGLVARGLERRGGPADVDAELLARTIIVLAEEAGRLILRDPDAYPPERLISYLRSILGRAR